MASVQVTCSGATPVVVPLGAPTGRVVLTMVGAPADVYPTLDGSAPVIPGDTVNSSDQCVLAGALGQQVVMQPPFFGDHMVAPVLRLASAGDAVVLVEW